MQSRDGFRSRLNVRQIEKCVPLRDPQLSVAEIGHLPTGEFLSCSLRHLHSAQREFIQDARAEVER